LVTARVLKIFGTIQDLGFIGDVSRDYWLSRPGPFPEGSDALSEGEEPEI
jgi:hypothetical protein